MPHRDLRFTHDYVEDAPPAVPIQGAVSGKAGGPVTDHSHTASGDGGTFDAANLRSDEDAEDGAVLSSDGAEGSEWRTLSLDSLADVSAPDPDDEDVLTWDESAEEWVASPPAGSSPDASDVTYTPTTAADWDSSADPGNADDALDQLAERVADLEGAGGGGDVATDTIWDAKGDLAVGTGANTAARLAVSDNGKRLVAASGETTGLKWEAEPRTFTFGVAGELAEATGALRLHAPWACTITNVTAAVGTAPVDASLIVDIHKDGTTIFTTQGNRPTIPSGNTTDLTSTPDVTAVAAGEYLTMDVDQVGSAVAGSDLIVQVRVTVP